MKKLFWIIILIIIVIVAYVALKDDTDETGDGTAMMSSATVTLAELNGSGVSGTAKLESEETGPLTVTVNLTGTPEGGSHPAHIHEGLCDNAGQVKYGLENVEGGSSVTSLQDINLEDLASELPLSVNVHLSDDDIGTYVACGNIEIIDDAMMAQ